MAESPNDEVQMYHPEASPDVPVLVTRQAFEDIWKAVGWRLTPKKEGK